MPKHVSGRYSARGRIAQFQIVPASKPSDSVLRTGAVLVASTALITAMTAPAGAAPARISTENLSGSARTVANAPSLTAPAVTAPKAAGPVVSKFGTIGVKAIAKPKPKPKPVVVPVAVAPAVAPTTVAATTTRTQTAASRSTTRSTVPTAPAPKPTPAAPPPPATGGVLGIAASLSGIPYLYGGSTPAGFDCSGFTMYVFGRAGVSLPRTASAQQAASTPVSSPVPGDLVFFGSPAYHMGIYAGPGMMYDSPRTGLSSGLRSIWSSSVSYGRP